MFTEQIIYSTPQATIKVSDHDELLPKGPLGNMHLHPELEFLYICQGSMLCHTEDNNFYAGEGEVVFINSRVPHFGEILEDGSDFIMVQFAYPTQVSEPFQYLIRYLLHTAYPCVVFPKDRQETSFLRDKMTGLLTDYQNDLRCRDYLMLAKKYEIMAFLLQNRYLADESELLAQINVTAILPVIQYIDTHYQQDISLIDISRRMNLHPNYLCRLFKKATGKTIMDYLNFVRVCNAEALLKAGRSVAEVSDLTGFSSQSHFSKVFKKYHLFSPSEYKKQSSLLYDLF